MPEGGAIQFRFRLVAEENLASLSEMFDLCFGIKVDDRYFRWKYLGNPAGPVVAFEALDGDVPAAFYGVIPELYVIQGQISRIYQSMDTATHPAYQRRGLFVKLATMTYERVKALDGHLEIIGFPGTQSHPGFVKKLGWKTVHDLPFLFAPVALLPLLSLGRRSGLRFEALDGMSDELAGFLSKRHPRSPVAKHWSPAVFDWRTFKHPLHQYRVVIVRDGGEIVGYCAYRIDTPKSCRIEWLEFVDEAAYRSHTRAVVAHVARAAGTRYIYTWQPTNPMLRQGYEAAGLLRNRLGRGPFAGTEPYIVYADPADGPGPAWFQAGSYDLQPLVHD